MFEEQKGGQRGWIRLIEERVVRVEVLEVVRGQILYYLVIYGRV